MIITAKKKMRWGGQTGLESDGLKQGYERVEIDGDRVEG